MKRLQLIIYSLLFVYLVGFVLLYLLQEKFIFLDDELPADHGYEFNASFEELNLENGDALLNALHFKVDSTKGLIIYFHGNQGNLTRWGQVAIPFVEMGYDVLIMDYRGFGKSKGKRTQKNLLQDAELFYQYALNQYNEDQIILFGRSLGTGVASYLAGIHTPSKVILETPYYSMASVGQQLYPIYPVSWAMRFNFKSYEYLKTATCSIYIFHGTDDRVVPYKQGKRLHESLPNSKGELITIPGGRHKDLADFDIYWSRLTSILNQEEQESQREN